MSNELPAFDNPPPPFPDPPPYIPGTRNDADEVVQPVILVLAGHFVRAQTSDGSPLYELSRDICNSELGTSQLSQVSFNRIISNVRLTADGAPRVHNRHKHVSELKYLPPVLSTGFSYCLDAMSRHAMGNLALKTASFPRSGLKIVRIKPESGSSQSGSRALKESPKEVQDVFDVRKKRGHYEWIQSGEDRIAFEEEAEGLHKLIVTSPLKRKTIDALVGSWCLRIWHDSLEPPNKFSLGCELISLM
ncbi:uncharacterized protein GGS25DRAFT_191451 [Hypoxylon fragiforme]|uniref:uncharacterized protein n=1 Tax=Hypoxylon fragiforme TaxID=63214 RepID=UPI0020C611E5|nr:uncharacterized protein GGS25DRAFT_191451 [Hypoxylon fragiforme]KAI2611339.1 hypothetical protein GGS25DRAFT_191451 [Hypoxylon fragiforme]